MSKYLGDFALSSVVRGMFNTRTAAGVPIDISSGALSVYKDGSVTQSTLGVTLTAPFDSITGLALFAIDTSADGTFYSSGSDFRVVITTGTVDSVSVVGSEVGSFSLNNRASLRPTIGGRTLDVSANGNAGIDWNNVDTPSATQNLSATTIKTATDVETDTANIQTRIPAALVSGRIDSSVGAMASNVLVAAAVDEDVITAIQTGLATPTNITAATGIVLAVSQPSYAPAKAGDAMALTSGERTTLAAVIWNALTSGMTTVGSIGKKLADWTIGTAQTGDSFARLGAPTGASVSADIALVKTDTATAAAEVVKIPRSATTQTAGAAATKTNTAVTPNQSITETIT